MTSAFQKGEAASVYLHFPCFDGIVSGALAILFFSRLRGWRFDSIQAVNYDMQDVWLDTHLAQHGCVVDFLYHPEAEVWCDHHATTFFNSELRTDFECRTDPFLWYDQESRSTARLLWNRAAETLGCIARLEEMVAWADRIDAADYQDVNEALCGSYPALKISRSLAIDPDPKYCDFLVRALCDLPMSELAAHSEIQRRVAQAEELGSEGLNRVAKHIHLHGNIALFDVATEKASISRYSAFYFHPNVHYSIGIFRSGDSTTVRVNANPWLHFRHPNLGEMMRAAAKAAGLPSSGGGHAQVGSIRLNKESDHAVEKVVAYFLKRLRGNLEDAGRSQWPRAVTR